VRSFQIHGMTSLYNSFICFTFMTSTDELNWEHYVSIGKVISQTPKTISSTKYYQTIAPQVSFRCFLKRLIGPTIFYWTCFHDPFYLFSKSTDMRVLNSVFLPVNPVGKIAEKADGVGVRFC